MMGGEAILFTPAVGLALTRLLAVLLIPVMPIVAGLRAVRFIGPADTRWSPTVEIAALLVGCLAAPAILVGSVIDIHYSFTDIFRSGGPWDLDWHGFLAYRAWPLLGAPADLLSRVAHGRAGADLTGITLVLTFAAVLLTLAPLLRQRSRAAMAHSLRNAILVTWGAYASLYLVILLAWVANQLNFWCFLVLFLALSLRRD